MKYCHTRRATAAVLLLIILASLSMTAFAHDLSDPVLSSEEQEQFIWDFLLEITENPAGAAGIMSNLYYESRLDPTATETGANLPKELEGYAYTLAVDEGNYEAFAEDRIGYGLAQWTDPTRKAALLQKAREEGKSIGDLELQLEFIAEELDRFNMMYRLSTTDSIRFASEYVLVNYEHPNIQDESIKEKRVSQGIAYYKKFTNPRESLSSMNGCTDAQNLVSYIASHSEEYNISSESGYCQAWVTAIYRKAGFSPYPSPNAADAAEHYGFSEDFENIPIGAAVYGHSKTRFGHVGIYIGNNQVCHNVGGVRTDSLENWLQAYDGFCWGWPGGVDLRTEH